MPRFTAINSGHMVGVIDHELDDAWVVEPEYSWLTAKTMADCLNDDPDMDPDELTRLMEKQR